VINAQSVINKTESVFDFIVDHHTDLLAITETWLSTDTEPFVHANILPQGYKMITKNREGRGGGVGLIYRASLACLARPSDARASFEHLEVNCSLPRGQVLLVTLYRPPPSPANRLTFAQFKEEFADYITDIICDSRNLLLVGDFNVHWNNENDPNARWLRDLAAAHGLEQHLHSPTHASGNTIDLVFTRTSDDILQESDVGTLISDHMAIHLVLKQRKPPPVRKTISFRKVKTIDQERVKAELATTQLAAPDAVPPERVREILHTTLAQLLDKHAPERSATITIRPTAAWMNQTITEGKRKRRQLERQWRRTGSIVHRAAFTEQRNLVSNLLRVAKEQHYHKEILDCSGNQKKLFGIIENLLQPNSRDDQSPAAASPDEFNAFFMEKVDVIHQSLTSRPPQTEPPDNQTTTPHSLTAFTDITSDDVIRAIMKSPTKSSEHDPWPTWMLKHHVNSLAPAIAIIFNHSLHNAIFPHEWKLAIVRPYLKKPTLDPAVLKNYRPVSNLSFLSKVLERLVCEQLHAYLQEHNMLPHYQSAYRKHHSVETALLRVQNDILESLDRQHGVVLILLDLSAAFDTVSHHLLIERLRHQFGFRDTALQWLQSYLAERRQAVRIGDNVSGVVNVKHGVPQGSVLGPVLFTIYTSPLASIIARHALNAHMYADDTQLYLSFKPGSPSSFDEAADRIKECVSDITVWMAANTLKLNQDKTEVMYITSPRARHHLANVTFSIDSHEITPCDKVRNLGCIMNSSSTMREHINAVCKSAFFHLRNIARIRQMLTDEAAATLVHAFITSRLDSCNVLLVGSPKTLLDKLQRVQNAAARVLCRKTKRDSISALLKELHWLPIPQRCNYKLLTITHKCIHGNAPAYLNELVSPYHPTRRLRSSDQYLLTEKRSHTKSFGDHAFSVAAPRTWNALPQHLRATTDYNTFKRDLKTHLFKTAFS
jgi:hypothetical protein